MAGVANAQQDVIKGADNTKKRFWNTGQQEGGRYLVDKVTLIKMCRREPKRRAFHLYNDTLVYGKSAGDTKKLISQHVIQLKDMRIENIQNDQLLLESSKNLKHGWVIYTAVKSFAVYAESEEEKSKWMTLLDSNIKQQQEKSRMTGGVTEHAAVWVPDFEVRKCMVCEKRQFNFVKRRHHCRKCGRVVCGSCSNHKALLLTQSSKPLRVCRECFEYMNQRAITKAATTNSLPSSIGQEDRSKQGSCNSSMEFQIMDSRENNDSESSDSSSQSISADIEDENPFKEIKANK